MLNSEGILELLEDEFGEADTELFCKMYSRFCELSLINRTEERDLDSDKYIYEIAGERIKNKMYTYTVDRESLRGLKIKK